MTDASDGDADTAGYAWRASTGRDYVITPGMMEAGRMPQFVGAPGGTR